MLQNQQIHIRDPFVLREGDTYYLYGTRGANFGCKTGGFDVYVSRDLKNWSKPHQCFNSEKFGLNEAANWAPEVHAYRGKYYMLATFVQKNGLRGTFVLRADSPLGPFVPHSEGAVTPDGWECLDGTLFVDEAGSPYLVFCHEHTQIIDGTICFMPLSDDLSCGAGEAVTLFAGSSPAWADPPCAGKHFVTDGPFMHRNGSGALLMIWSTFIKRQYAQCVVRFEDGRLDGRFTHLEPLFTENGGHGMIFHGPDQLYLSLHNPDTHDAERPVFLPLRETEDGLALA